MCLLYWCRGGELKWNQKDDASDLQEVGGGGTGKVTVYLGGELIF